MPSQRTAAAWSHTNWSIISSKMKIQTSINNFVWHLFLIRMLSYRCPFIRFDISIHRSPSSPPMCYAFLFALVLFVFVLRSLFLRWFVVSWIRRHYYEVTKYDGFGRASKFGLDEKSLPSAPTKHGEIVCHFRKLRRRETSSIVRTTDSDDIFMKPSEKSRNVLVAERGLKWPERL